jgi:hypothetical protein
MKSLLSSLFIFIENFEPETQEKIRLVSGRGKSNFRSTAPKYLQSCVSKALNKSAFNAKTFFVNFDIPNECINSYIYRIFFCIHLPFKKADYVTKI